MLPKKAILLVRISDDREGEEKGVKRQEVDCRAHAQRLGWGIAQVVFIEDCPPGVVIENSISAFKRRKVKLPDGKQALRVVRPGFRLCLELLNTGAVDGFIAYDLDRVCRDPRDLEDLIDVVEQRRVPVTSVSGSLRLASDADITMARVMVAVANKSSRDTSRRVARKHEELAETGKPAGGGLRPFGYEPDGITIRQHEAGAIKTMAKLLLDGESIHGVVRHLNEQGPPPAYAKAWTTRGVKNTLSSPRVTGLRVFRGEVVGEAAWPAILDRATWDRVQVALKERRKLPGEDNALVRWLTGVLVCGLCGAGLVGSGPKADLRYWCATTRKGCGKISINAVRAEAEIERQMLQYLAAPTVIAAMKGTFTDDAMSAARAELAADEKQLKELAGMWARRELTFPEYSEARTIINERIQGSRALLGSVIPGVVRTLLAGDPVEEWGNLDPTRRREVVRAVTSGYRVLPASEGQRRFEPGRMVPLGS
ncbi:recombinase family protein [Kitasatospora cineracea]